MHRRRFIALLGTTITAARTLRAQQKATAVIGYLSVFSPPANPADLARAQTRQGLSETGFIEGRNMVTEYRWAEGHFDRLPALAADLVDRKVDLIVTLGGTPPALAAKSATSTIPIVFTGAGDPVGFGLVASLAQPGGNVTGFSNFSMELMPKRLAPNRPICRSNNGRPFSSSSISTPPRRSALPFRRQSLPVPTRLSNSNRIQNEWPFFFYPKHPNQFGAMAGVGQ